TNGLGNNAGVSVRSSAAGSPPAAPAAPTAEPASAPPAAPPAPPAPTAGPAPAPPAVPGAEPAAPPPDLATQEPAFGDRTPVPWQPPDGCVFRDLLRNVIDPELGVNIVDLGLVYDVRVRDGTARVWMTMTTPGCPLGAYFDDEIRAALGNGPG